MLAAVELWSPDLAGLPGEVPEAGVLHVSKPRGRVKPRSRHMADEVQALLSSCLPVNLRWAAGQVQSMRVSEFLET